MLELNFPPKSFWVEKVLALQVINLVFSKTFSPAISALQQILAKWSVTAHAYKAISSVLIKKSLLWFLGRGCWYRYKRTWFVAITCSDKNTNL